MVSSKRDWLSLEGTAQVVGPARRRMDQRMLDWAADCWCNLATPQLLGFFAAWLVCSVAAGDWGRGNCAAMQLTCCPHVSSVIASSVHVLSSHCRLVLCDPSMCQQSLNHQLMLPVTAAQCAAMMSFHELCAPLRGEERYYGGDQNSLPSLALLLHPRVQWSLMPTRMNGSTSTAAAGISWPAAMAAAAA